MTGTTRRTVIVTMAALAVAVLLVWSASTGPSGLADGVTSRTVVGDTTTRSSPTSADDHHAKQDEHAGATARRLGTGLQWLDDVIGILAFLAIAWVLTALLRGLLNLVGDRLPDKQLVLDLEPLPDRGAGRDAVQRERDRLQSALASSDVRNGIVACWVVLEEAAAEAGVVRRVAETPTEFVVRFLHTIDLDPRPVAQLAELYREARFSTHPMGEASRTRAQAALHSVLEELDRAGAPA